MRVLVMADRSDGETGYVGERLRHHGADLVPAYRDDLAATGAPALDGIDLVLLLGSAHGVAEPGRAAYVEAESTMVRTAIDTGVPVIGICYGAQLSAHALGGTVARASESEIGWYYVESADPALCPPGPWVQFHDDAFTVPPGTRELGRSEVCPQGFVADGPAGPALVAWQFHPEVTPEILERWVREDADGLAERGYDGAAMIVQAHEREAFSRAAAYALVDMALDTLGLRVADATAGSLIDSTAGPAGVPDEVRGRMGA